MTDSKTKKKYEKPILTKVVLNPAQAVLSACSSAPLPTKSGGGGTTCLGSGPAANRCKKTGVGGTGPGIC